MSAAAENKPESLSDVMLAMDVVDTLRHQQVLIDRELNASDRDKRMMERLRSIPCVTLEQRSIALLR